MSRASRSSAAAAPADNGEGLTADQHHRPRHQTATQHPIQFIKSGFDTGRIFRGDIFEPAHLGLGSTVANGRFGNRPDAQTRERVPGLTGRTLALPLTMLCTAVATHVGRLVFRLRQESDSAYSKGPKSL